jgi:hypothetical protein
MQVREEEIVLLEDGEEDVLRGEEVESTSEDQVETIEEGGDENQEGKKRELEETE